MSRRTRRYGPAHAVAGELNIEGILETLVKHEVDFILIGGVAVGHHGFVRATKDVDIVPDPNRAQLRKLWNALVDLAAQPLSLGDFQPEEMPAPFTLEGLLQRGDWDLGTRYEGGSTSSSTSTASSRAGPTTPAYVSERLRSTTPSVASGSSATRTCSI